MFCVVVGDVYINLIKTYGVSRTMKPELMPLLGLESITVSYNSESYFPWRLAGEKVRSVTTI